MAIGDITEQIKEAWIWSQYHATKIDSNGVSDHPLCVQLATALAEQLASIWAVLG